MNVTRIGKGETQIGFALTPYPEQGYHGQSKHYPAPLKNVRLIASNLGRTVVVAMVVLKDSPIKSINDIKGKRIVTGDRGWGTTELVEALMAAAGMPPEKFKADGGTISYTSITDRSKALQDRNVDAIFIPAQVNYPDLMAVQQAAGIRVIGFPNDLVEKTLGTMPGLIKSKVPKVCTAWWTRICPLPASSSSSSSTRASRMSWSTGSPSSGGNGSRRSTRSRPDSIRPT